jgi:alkanesulfonate monooxygenase SsuD/methylene tetrahydromethanopterin reductase-like flavin-dependent oxidoreductase (luciferase family)
MQYGAGLPLGAAMDPVAARDMVQTLDESGFNFVGLAGHLLTAESGRYPDRPPMTYSGDFNDPFVLFGYLSALTEQIKFRTSILILPLYNTMHIARAGADLQRMSGGRFELGVGISWNPDEYAAAGQDFTTRGRRLEEQLIVLRELWSKPYVSFQGRWHQIDNLGLGASVPQRPIPI